MPPLPALAATALTAAALTAGVLTLPPAPAASAGRPGAPGPGTGAPADVTGPSAPPRDGGTRPGAGTAVAYRWPLVPQPGLVRGFDTPASFYAAGHRGVDLAAGPGQPVHAAAGGTVTHAGAVAGRGVVVVLHADGIRTTYEPVAVTVGAGAAVAAGDLLGTVAAERPHCAPAHCLHWGARRGRDYVDPLTLLVAPGPPLLLPLGGPG